MAEQETPQNQHQHTTQNPAAEGSTHTTQGRPEGSASTTVATDEPLAPHDFLVPADTDELIGAEHRDEDFDTLTDCDDDGLPDLSFRMDMDQLMGWEHPLPTGRYADREISWMAFNQRVLEQSEDPHLPLLERAWFSAIFTSNLDEFYMVRISGLKRRIAAGIAKKSASGLEPTQVLEALRLRSRELVERQVEGFHTAILPALADHGIHLRRWNELNENQHERLSSHFRHQLFPVLTPLAVDPSHPFPYISGLSLTLAVLVRNPVSDKRHVALVKVPESLPRLVCVDSLGTTHPPQFYIGRNGGASFVTIEDIILAHLEHLFPGMEILEAFPFRLTRDEDLEVEEDEAEDLVTALETELAKRRFGAVVRMEIDQQMSTEVRDFLAEKLEVAAADLVALPTPLDMRLGNALHELAIPELCYPTYTPTTPSALQGNDPTISSDIFSVMRSQDILLHHPYDSFATTVQAFITQAARDPHVLAMKQTLYRTSGDSPIVSALIEAARAGKQVVAIVEIKARFDEEANIEWARKMERAGVHVVYGMVGLKTHCKLSLVVRQEGDVLRRYCHIGTGNYHPKTARGYEDFGLLTCNTDVAQDLTRLFNQLSGFAPRSTFHRLLVAPLSIRDGLIARIEEQTLRHLRGEEAWIGIKVNAVVDEKVIDALYRASQAGVRVDVLVRGICAIRAGIPGLSDNIRVRSILGRYLEHSRIYAFGPSGEEEVWIGSADLMHRNLDRRVEVLVRIEGDDHRRHLAQIIRQGTSAKVSSWRLRKGGTWKRKTHTKDAEPLRDLQHELMEETARNNRKIAELGAQVASLTLSTSGTESP